MTLAGANLQPKIAGVEPQSGKSNYFIGNDPSKWVTKVPHFGRVEYTGVYRGVDLTYRGNGSQLEYDWIVNPGANPRDIRMSYQGIRRLRVEENGDLLLETPGGSLRQHKPLVYQERDGKREVLNGRFVRRGKREVGFEVAAYDRSRPLTIDPVLAYASFLGGSGIEAVIDVAVDSQGSAYLTGFTDSMSPSPFSVNPIFPYNNSGPPCAYGYLSSFTGQVNIEVPCFDMFVSKMNPAGTELVYSTYIGGSLADTAYRIRVDANFNAYVAGYSSSPDFPVTSGAYQGVLNNAQSGVLLALSPGGDSLNFATYFGSSGANYSDYIYGMALDTTGIYITGTTQNPNFPAPNSLFPFSAPGVVTASGGANECYTSKFDLSATTLLYSTFLAGACSPIEMTVDSNQNTYIVGHAFVGMPTTPNAIQPKWTFSSQSGCNKNGSGTRCASDAFLLVLNSTATNLVYCTYLGGDDEDQALGVSLDPAGNIYVSGYTYSPQNYGGVPFMTTPGAYQPNREACETPTNCPRMGDAFVAKISPSGSLLAATYLGATQPDAIYQGYTAQHPAATAHSVVPDQEGNIFVGGTSVYINFPSVTAVPPPNAGGQEVFIAKFDPDLTTLLFSSYFGGTGDDDGNSMTIDSSDSLYMVGRTTSPSTSFSAFPTTAQLNPYQGTYGGGISDGFIVKLANADLSLSVSSTADANLRKGPMNGEAKPPHGFDTSSNPIVVSPSGTFSMTATILNQATAIANFSADNPGLMIPTAPDHTSLTGCSYSGSNSCLNLLDPQNPVNLPSGTSLAVGQSMDVTLTFTLDGTLSVGNILGWTLYTHADTNDPNTPNNYASFSAVVGVPVVVQTSPVNLQVTVNGGLPQTAPTTIYVEPNTSYTYCVVTPQTVGGMTYTFASWGGATSSTQNCVTLPLPSGGNLTASFGTTSISPALTISKTHQGNLAAGQTGAAYQITVGNSGTASSSGQVTVTETVPTGLTLVSLAGSGWTCAATSCNRSDVLNPSTSYPPITVSVNVAGNAPALVTNMASVSGGGSAGATAMDPTTITPVPSNPILTIGKTHQGYFGPGQSGAVYQLVVSNSGMGATSGQVTVTDTVPTGLTLVSMAGTGWTCAANSCMRSDVLNSGASYPSITASVNVAGNAAAQVTNVASVSGGGSLTASASDLTAIRTGTPPFGYLETPITGSTGSGGVAVTGWALSEAGIAYVDIWRNPNHGEIASPNGLVYIGTADIVTGSRPDVQNSYPNIPMSNQAGWGYAVLTNELPSNTGSTSNGNGTYTIHALAHGNDGQITDLPFLSQPPLIPTTTLIVNNAAAVLPFGTIDTPTQGGTESGGFYNFGWALTPQPNSIPIDGSTINVFIDNMFVGHPTYNQPRLDIETLFPGYQNTNGAVGYFYIDTTTLANGVHTISWVVRDSAQNAQGIGSRYFTVQNPQ
jgi:uncharacterized repeat protein (TIGR01451 family)